MTEHWWEKSSTLIILTLLTAVPLVLPLMPPLADAPVHIGRYAIQYKNGSDAHLNAYFIMQWAVVANLGVDILVLPLTPLLGIETASKLVIMSIPVLTSTGIIFVSYQIHDRVNPMALFALPLAYSFSFQMGFVNYCLSMAVSLILFALWIKLDKLSLFKTRALSFIIFAPLVWILHFYGWAMLILVCFIYDLVRTETSTNWVRKWFDAALRCVPLFLPALLTLYWRVSSSGLAATDWLAFHLMFTWIIDLFRDRWIILDLVLAAIIYGVAFFALIAWWRTGDRVAITIAAILTMAVILIPSVVFGSAYANVRLIPFALMFWMIAVIPPKESEGISRALALTAVAVLIVRVTSTTWSFLLHDQEYRKEAAAISHIPRGKAVFMVEGRPCGGTLAAWRRSRVSGVANLVIIRRSAFVNTQFEVTGAQLVRAREFIASAKRGTTAIVANTETPCGPSGPLSMNDPSVKLPTTGFDYIWLIDIPKSQWPRQAAVGRKWSNDRSVLYELPFKKIIQPVPTRSPLEQPKT